MSAILIVPFYDKESYCRHEVSCISAIDFRGENYMSAGTFVRSKYAADYGDGTAIHPIRVQPESLDATAGAEDNGAPSGDRNNPISAQISRGKRARGLSPRYLTLQLPVGTTPPTGYAESSITRIPALNRPFYEAAIAAGSVTYLGRGWDVVSASPERAT